MKAMHCLSSAETCALTNRAHFLCRSKTWEQNPGPPGEVSVLISAPVDVSGTWQREVKSAEGAKVVNQLTLRWGDQPGSYRWVQGNPNST